MAQRIVIDANATLGLFLKLPYSAQIDYHMQAWQVADAQLFVPVLWEYECMTGVRRAVIQKLISPQRGEQIMAGLLALNLQRVTPTLDLHRSAFNWAARIGQAKVYDAHYVAVAESLSAEFWTADQRLANALHGLGVVWVQQI